MEKTAPTPAPTRAMRTRTVRSASQATGTVPEQGGRAGQGHDGRIPALERWKASRMLGISTLKALWVAWSSSCRENSTASGNSGGTATQACAPRPRRRAGSRPPPRPCDRRPGPVGVSAPGVGPVAVAAGHHVEQLVPAVRRCRLATPPGNGQQDEQDPEGGREELPARGQEDRAALHQGGPGHRPHHRAQAADGGGGEHGQAGRDR